MIPPTAALTTADTAATLSATLSETTLTTIQEETDTKVQQQQQQLQLVDTAQPPPPPPVAITCDWAATDQQLAKYNLKSVEAATDATDAAGDNCQYRMIAHVLQEHGKGLFPLANGHVTVRQAVATELETHSERYAHLVPTTPNGQGQDQGQDPKDPKDPQTVYAAFVARTKQDGERGDHVTLQASCNAYGLSLLMFCPADNLAVDVQPSTQTTASNPTTPLLRANIVYASLVGSHDYRGTAALLTKSKKPTKMRLKKPKTVLSLVAYLTRLNPSAANGLGTPGTTVRNKVATGRTVWTIADSHDATTATGADAYAKQKTDIGKVINQCHQLLYDNGSIVGTKAQNDIMRLLCLHILKDQFNDESSELVAACVRVKDANGINDTKFAKFMGYCKDMRRLTAHGLEFFKEWRFLVRDLLGDALPSVYGEEDERFNCDNYTVIVKMIDRMADGLASSAEFRDAFSTTCGDIHEMFRAYGGGSAAKELGQFFTTRELIHAIFHGLDLPKLLPKTQTHNMSVYDPCMGTGGFLTRMFQLLDVHPDDLYGCETEADTIKFGQMSVVLTTGKMGANLAKCNSLSENKLLVSDTKMDAIVTNPPFGTKMKYADLRTTFEDNFPDSPVKFKDVYPINTSIGACLFLQQCVYMLAEGGVCAIVLPDGELFESHSKWSATFRKWWCEKVNIRTILKVPPGVFKHAGVRTNVVVFTKDGPTSSIQYHELADKTCTSITELFAVDIADIVRTGYSLDHKAYLKEDTDECDVPMVALGDVCDIQYGTRVVKKNSTPGDIPVYGGGGQTFTTTEPNRTGKSLVISRFGVSPHCVRILDIPFFLNDSGLTLASKNETVLRFDYICHVLQSMENRIFSLASGAAQANLNMEKFKSFQIPLPPLETQHQIVHELETIETSIETLRTRVKQLKHEKTMFHKYGQKAELRELWRGCEWRALGEVCDVNSSKIKRHPTSYGSEEKTAFRFHTGSPSTVLYTTTPEVLQPVIVINKTNGQGNCHITYDDKTCSIAQQAFAITEKEDSQVNFDYIFQCLVQTKQKIEFGYTGCNHKNLSLSFLTEFKIPLPTPAIQQQSIAIFEAKSKHLATLDDCIEREEQHVKDLQRLGKDVISSFCSAAAE
jgi:restriction endonuclease S subunit